MTDTSPEVPTPASASLGSRGILHLIRKDVGFPLSRRRYLAFRRMQRGVAPRLATAAAGGASSDPASKKSDAELVADRVDGTDQLQG